MDPREEIITEVAKRVCDRITRKVILKLQKMEPCGYSDLKNVWNEICVQVQSEQFTTWNLYDNTVRGLVGGLIEKLNHYEQVAIWLQTDAGLDWHWERTENADKEDFSMLGNKKEEHVPLDIDDVVNYVTHEYVYEQAGRWSNSSVRDF